MATTGTGFFTTIPGTSIKVAMTDENNSYMLVKGTAASIPVAGTAGYGTGCVYIATDTGSLYTNQGTSTLSSFVVLT